MSHYSRILGLTFTATVLLAGQAFAHAHLKTSVPADKAILSAPPTELDLTFSEELNLKFTGLDIVGPAQAKVKTGAATLADGGKVLVVPVADRLETGTYTVEWHVLSVDGHKTNGSYSFTVKP